MSAEVRSGTNIGIETRFRTTGDTTTIGQMGNFLKKH
jgi:hypothetical protein